MKRRDFVKALGILGSSLAMPQVLGKNGLINSAHAKSVSERELRNAKAIVAGEIDFQDPTGGGLTTFPTVINVFMYGGPSELAGNLTNIAAINADSQNKYTDVRGNILDAVVDGGEITPNGFWNRAGGVEMEAMLAAGDMSIYRTINRVVDDTKAHRTSIFSAQTGNLDLDAPGMGTTLAAVLRTFMPEKFDNLDDTPILPFVSLEGDAVTYTQGDIDDLPLWLRAVSLDNEFNNPYQRNRIPSYMHTGDTKNSNDPANDLMCIAGSSEDYCGRLLDTLATRVSTGYADKYEKIINAFKKRQELDDFFANGSLAQPVDAVPTAINDRFTGSFGANIRAATVLALENPDTKLITLSTGGLGGWDDHDNAIVKYENRMRGLMQNVQAAVDLINQGTVDGTQTPKGNSRNNIIINLFGEFGRNVNLNGSMGWDHGNNMNLYTFSGSGIDGRNLGQVIGQTEHFGTPGQNRLFTRPASGSPQWEPFSIAATIYKHFGVLNPDHLTSDLEMSPAGFGAITDA